MLIPPSEAFQIVLTHVRPLEQITLPLEKVLGYCLAEKVRADRDLPPADRSAMDGYAIRSTDLARSPSLLRVVGEVAAGSPSRPLIRPGTCARILTGANVPPGADTVIMVEQTSEDNGRIIIRGNPPPGSNILRKGEDAKKGELLLGPGTTLAATQIGVCAAVGRSQLRVHRRPRLMVFCTGEELRSVTDKVKPHEIRNSTGPALCAALEMWGYPGVKYKVIPDDLTCLASHLKRASQRHDVVLLTGGVSVGRYDFVPEAVERIGGVIRFHGVAMKPGKPSLYATIGKNRHIFGLPGNPLSTLTSFHEFVLPAIRRLCGIPLERCRPQLYLPVASDLVIKSDRARYVLARLAWLQSGPVLEPIHAHSSADLVAGGRADGALIVPSGTGEVSAGSIVEFRPWRPLP